LRILKTCNSREAGALLIVRCRIAGTHIEIASGVEKKEIWCRGLSLISTFREFSKRRTVLQERVVLINNNGNFAVSRGACDPLGVVIRLAVSISFKSSPASPPTSDL
jgi:hypothetical protein